MKDPLYLVMRVSWYSNHIKYSFYYILATILSCELKGVYKRPSDKRYPYVLEVRLCLSGCLKLMYYFLYRLNGQMVHIVTYKGHMEISSHFKTRYIKLSSITVGSIQTVGSILSNIHTLKFRLLVVVSY